MSYRHLSESERGVIFYLHMVGRGNAEIGGQIGRHPSTIGRELRRNICVSGQYLPDIAQVKQATAPSNRAARWDYCPRADVDDTGRRAYCHWYAE